MKEFGIEFGILADPCYTDRVFEDVRDGKLSPAEARDRLTVRVLVKHAHELPLVNAETGEKKIIEGDNDSSAFEEFQRMYLASNGNWDVDLVAFNQMLDSPEGEAYGESMMPRITQEFEETIRKALIVRATKAKDSERSTIGTGRKLWLVGKLATVLVKLLRQL